MASVVAETETRVLALRQISRMPIEDEFVSDRLVVAMATCFLRTIIKFCQERDGKDAGFYVYPVDSDAATNGVFMIVTRHLKKCGWKETCRRGNCYVIATDATPQEAIIERINALGKK